MSEADVSLPVHVLLRIKSEDGKTIEEHSNIISDKGSAVLGKLGQAISPAFITALNEQIARVVDTFLFLTTREGWNGPYVTYQCRLVNVTAKLEESKYSLVPKYYSSSYESVTVWFEISTMDRMSKSEMNRIFVVSSGRPIMSVIKSSATVFRVGLQARSTIAVTP